MHKGKKIAISHVINPVKVDQNSDLFVAQPITFETMRRAKNFVKNTMIIKQYAVFYPEDEETVPSDFIKANVLERSVYDCGNFSINKKLPILKDIINRVADVCDTEYIIYTNVDIALQKDFYKQVAEAISQGYDSFIITRRTISGKYDSIDQIEDMYKEDGIKHPGFDCFIFKKDIYKKLDLMNACIGANWIGRIFIANLMAYADNFKLFEDFHATFHIGDDRDWTNEKFMELHRYNEKQLLELFNRLLVKENIKNLEKIKEMRDYNIHNGTQQIPDDIIGLNTTDHNIEFNPTDVFHTEFRHSSDWDYFNVQKLRQDPIFIVGYPRSGTTLMQSLLITQEGMISIYETHFFSIVRKSILSVKDCIDYSCMDKVIDTIRERIAFSVTAEKHVRQLCRNRKLSVKMLFETLIIDSLISKVKIGRLNQLRWIEKTPGHALYLDIIKQFYPKSKIIFMMRNPEKAILSRRKNFGFNNEQSWPIQKHAMEWVEYVRQIEMFKESHSESILIMRLEDLVNNLDIEMERVCSFMGIDYHLEQVKQYKEKSVQCFYPWETWKSGASKDIDKKVVEREYLLLNQDDKNELLRIAGQMMVRFNYTEQSSLMSKINLQFFKRQQYKVRLKLKYEWEGIKNKLKKMKSDTLLIRHNHKHGKIDISHDIPAFFGRHRSGWTYAVHQLKPLHNINGIRLDSFIERTFCWDPHHVIPHKTPWIGFIHVPPKVPEWFQSEQSNKRVFESEAWKISYPFCKGLFTLSKYHREYLEKILDVPVENFFFPTETPKLTWTWEGFESNSSKKVIQIGWWLRKLHSIFRLPEISMQKVFLRTRSEDFFEKIFEEEKNILIKQGLFNVSMYDNTDIWEFVSNKEYDKILSENILFIELYDSSANNLIVESIVRNAPLLVNPLPAVVEYLGSDYPFYFNSLEEAAEKAENNDLIFKTHEYLKNYNFKSKLKGEYFMDQFQSSSIYGSL